MTTQGRRQRFWLLGAFAVCGGLFIAEMSRGGADRSGTVAALISADDPVGSWAPPAQAGAALVCGPPKKDTGDEEGKADEKGDADEVERNARTTGLRPLTPEEINRIRFMELRGMRLSTDQPDRVKVSIPKQTVEDYLAEMSEDPRLRGKTAEDKERDRRAFRKMTAALKLHWIAYNTQTKYADKIEIKSDPEVFLTFKKNVLPVVIRNCAKQPGCHANATAEEKLQFRLFTNPKRPASEMYANFIMLNDTTVDFRPMIDRTEPENSLLLTYMLPSDKGVRAEFRHPGTNEFKPAFRLRSAPGLRRLRDWIASLKHPAESYGVRFYPRLDGTEPDSERPKSRPGEPDGRP